ncbi:ABC-three component system middle component 2 [Microbacterium sp. NPDC056234]|uniref:ABC-three component system middle component 2 n=1 Tax=Microbacterium sp. NPDC056234 TaxID=3345757 RepID=UPI0035D8EE81
MTQLLNSPLEIGIRIVALLTALYPARADLTRIVLLDHAVLHSGDFSGVRSLHPEIPGRVGELGVKRELVHQAILLMGARGLIIRDLDISGISYGASDDARPFLDAIDAPYLSRLRERCNWAATEFGPLDDESIRARLDVVFGRWAEEFEHLNEDEHRG